MNLFWKVKREDFTLEHRRKRHLLDGFKVVSLSCVYKIAERGEHHSQSLLSTFISLSKRIFLCLFIEVDSKFFRRRALDMAKINGFSFNPVAETRLATIPLDVLLQSKTGQSVTGKLSDELPSDFFQFVVPRHLLNSDRFEGGLRFTKLVYANHS